MTCFIHLKTGPFLIDKQNCIKSTKNNWADCEDGECGDEDGCEDDGEGDEEGSGKSGVEDGG